MNLLLAIIVSAVVISVVIIATIRKRLKVKSNELLEQIKGLISYSDRSNYEQAKERLSAFNKEILLKSEKNYSMSEIRPEQRFLW